MTVGSSLNYGSEEGNQMTHSFYRSAVHVQRHSFVFSLQCSTRITYCSDTRFRITLSPFCIVHEVLKELKEILKEISIKCSGQRLAEFSVET